MILQALIGLPFAAIALLYLSSVEAMMPPHVWVAFAVAVTGGIIVFCLDARGPLQALGVALGCVGVAIFVSPVVRLFSGQLAGKGNLRADISTPLTDLVPFLPQADERSGLLFLALGTLLILIGVLLADQPEKTAKRVGRRV